LFTFGIYQQVFQHLLHEILHRQLATSLSSSSEVARLYLEVTPPEHQHSLSMFLKVGTAVDVHALDALLLASFKALTPEYRKFLCMGPTQQQLFKTHLPDMFAESCLVSATLIQARWRVKKAVKRTQLKRRSHSEHVKAKLKAQEEEDNYY
jgi:hypothetical protein